MTTWKIEPIHAQILIEVFRYPEHHVDMKTIQRKLPPKFKGGPIEVFIKHLANRPTPLLVKYFPKPEDCYLCTSTGRYVADQLISGDYEAYLEEFEQMEKEFASKAANVCEDAWGLAKTSSRHINGSNGKLLVHYSCEPSDNAYRDDQVSWRIDGKVPCPRCNENIRLAYDVNPENGTSYDSIECKQCNLSIKIQKCLFHYYVLTEDVN